MAGKKGVSSTRDPTLRKAKLTQVVELAIKGLPEKDIAALVGVTPKTISAWKTEARKKGIMDEVRERIIERHLPKALEVYDTVLSADVNDITERRTVKAHELKLRAARDIAQGLGALRKEASSSVHAKETLNLEGYVKLREARNALGPAREAAIPQDVTEGVFTEGNDEQSQTDRQRGLPAPSDEVPGDEGGGKA